MKSLAHASGYQINSQPRTDMNANPDPLSSDFSNDSPPATIPREVPPADACTAGVCVVCGGRTLIEIRGKLQCGRCHTICETCCEGGRA